MLVKWEKEFAETMELIEKAELERLKSLKTILTSRNNAFQTALASQDKVARRGPAILSHRRAAADGGWVGGLSAKPARDPSRRQVVTAAHARTVSLDPVADIRLFGSQKDVGAYVHDPVQLNALQKNAQYGRRRRALGTDGRMR